MATDSLSVVVPVLDDAEPLEKLLNSLRESPVAMHIIVVDGGSRDDSVAIADHFGCQVLQAPSGRGSQLDEGCRVARGNWIWMLHADCQISEQVMIYLNSLQGVNWGRFDVRFDGGGSGLQLVAGLMNWRSRISGICTGDQGIFAHRALLDRIGGVPRQPLMEDVELCSRLKRISRPLTPRLQLVTSPRRWEERGLVQTILGMWWIRLRYWWGVSADRLAREYYAG